jgi:CRP-like cAMP-binding protein
MDGEGEPGDTLYLVVKGRMRVERGGREIARLGPGRTSSGARDLGAAD